MDPRLYTFTAKWTGTVEVRFSMQSQLSEQEQWRQESVHIHSWVNRDNGDQRMVHCQKLFYQWSEAMGQRWYTPTVESLSKWTWPVMQVVHTHILGVEWTAAQGGGQGRYQPNWVSELGQWRPESLGLWTGAKEGKDDTNSQLSELGQSRSDTAHFHCWVAWGSWGHRQYTITAEWTGEQKSWYTFTAEWIRGNGGHRWYTLTADSLIQWTE